MLVKIQAKTSEQGPPGQQRASTFMSKPAASNMMSMEEFHKLPVVENNQTLPAKKTKKWSSTTSDTEGFVTGPPQAFQRLPGAQQEDKKDTLVAGDDSLEDEDEDTVMDRFADEKNAGRRLERARPISWKL